MKTKKSDSIQNEKNTENKGVRLLTDEEAAQVSGGAYIDDYGNGAYVKDYYDEGTLGLYYPGKYDENTKPH